MEKHGIKNRIENLQKKLESLREPPKQPNTVPEKNSEEYLSQINMDKHVNSRLFQKFLKEETKAKNHQPKQPKKEPQPSFSKSHENGFGNQFQEPERKTPQPSERETRFLDTNRSSKYMETSSDNFKESLKRNDSRFFEDYSSKRTPYDNRSRDPSPLQPSTMQLSPLNRSQKFQNPLRENPLETSEIKGTSVHIPSGAPGYNMSRTPSYAQMPQEFMHYPMYPPMFYPQYDMMMRQQMEAMQAQLTQMSMGASDRVKREYESLLQEKDFEIQSLKKEVDNSKLTVMELEDQLRHQNNREAEVLVEENEDLRKQLAEASNKDSDTVKKLQRENSNLKSQCEDMYNELNYERSRADELENKLNNLKKKVSYLENELHGAHSHIEDLEAELNEARQYLNRMSRQQESETQNPKRIQSTYDLRAEEQRFDTGPRRNIARTNNSSEVSNALHWNPRDVSPRPSHSESVRELTPIQEREKSPFYKRERASSAKRNGDAASNLENKLAMLQGEKQKLESEYAKIPEHARNAAQRRRRQDLELELEILDTNIGNLKAKLRNYKN